MREVMEVTGLCASALRSTQGEFIPPIPISPFFRIRVRGILFNSIGLSTPQKWSATEELKHLSARTKAGWEIVRFLFFRVLRSSFLMLLLWDGSVVGLVYYERRDF